MPPRTLAIGDIHGCDVALQTLLNQVSPAADDTVIVLGDVVDRGPGTRQAIEQLLELRAQCQLIFILGNHEEMMLDALAGGKLAGAWLRYGGHAVIASYGGDPSRIPPEHLDFLREGRDYWESRDEIFVHANLRPGLPLAEQDIEWLRWTHLTGWEPAHDSGKRVICGHTSQRSGQPLAFAGWACIDTFACGPGWLTCLDIDTDEIYQADQQGRFRTGWLL